MSSEDEIRKLLKFRNDLEILKNKLTIELEDTKNALMQIDKIIVLQGFKQPKPLQEIQKVQKTIIEKDTEGSSIQAKDGTILGSLIIDEKNLLFIPRSEFQFNINLPPYQSFLVERVLDNMKNTDQQKALEGEMEIDSVLNYSVELEGEVIKSISITNYGGDRRLREIQSSIRWSFDKMYDKLKRG
ncbi:hypothetical protein JW865_01370 [Candidatus Bathyarchaeota archaeon]|nr:hypothetical protein [Candidatus Bathyarchaeota archaeon]